MELEVKKAIKGDKEALLNLILKEKDNYYKLAYFYMKNEHDALDILQEMIIVVYKEISKLKKISSFYIWSKKILVNLCKKELSKKNKFEEVDNLLSSEEKGFKDIENKIYLKFLIESLNNDQKEVIKLKYYLDYSYDEIANILDIPLGTVKSRINKGINKIRKNIGGDINDRLG
ncbi:MAG: RNA polymerase sigma factor [Clostridium sp.]|uniref:RNA polymerase sigma factor n=1 Tax=Clostridium sp. TaxID=1506 RepID=UPI0025BCCF5F|nr:RNA polymerase sigma factor [Clostridium sp.]MCF0148991.1 RNA polymerase sigma factor [Clostridium sp.]